ncbi:MAG: metallophosphoesterase, partial [Solirubrobacterales bacterium]|nr:metallophosphoesterase [Solirubrobacterales bacterium]
MNVLALYDIHGNLDALEAVLADPRASRADAIVVGGDVVPGAFAPECLSLLGRHELPVHWIRGNGEREVAEAAANGVDAESLPPDAVAELTAAITAAALDADAASNSEPRSSPCRAVLECLTTGIAIPA